jgi:SpoVK/Ycf46/Vps4 family AAA+-type ATPase
VAQSWKEILLFDEADIFLGQRTSRSDYRREMLTSLFLRISEYFEGIMFLTTNRMSDFDEALESRVQIIVHYPSLGPESRAKIWEKHMEAEMIPPDWQLPTVCKEFGERYKLNGREIRNIVQASVRICRQRNQLLSKAMIEDIYELRYQHRDGIRRYLKAGDSHESIKT